MRLIKVASVAGHFRGLTPTREIETNQREKHCQSETFLFRSFISKAVGYLPVRCQATEVDSHRGHFNQSPDNFFNQSHQRLLVKFFSGLKDFNQMK